MIEVKLKKAHPNAITPKYMTEGSSGCDVHSTESVIIPPMTRKVVGTGIHVCTPEGYECQIRSRSGLAAKKGVFVLNGVATIDKDYIGELKVILFNTDSEPFPIEIGDRIAQLVWAPVVQAKFIEVDSLENTSRGDGGLGSTGI